MKLALLTLTFLLFALPLAFSNDADRVLDGFGNPLVPGEKYSIEPSIVGPPGGGVRLGRTGNSKCPVTVLQDYFEVVPGDPVKFSIVGESTSEIFIGTPLDIEFAEKPECAESSKWAVFFDSDIQKAYVGIGGSQGHPGQQILSGTFNIQKSRIRYKLVFCLTGSSTCLDIGVYDNRDPGEHARRLVLTENEAFDIVFIGAGPYSGIRTVV